MDELENLYNAVSGKFDVGTIEDFKGKMASPEDRKRFYDVVSNKGFDLGGYDTYESRLKKKEKSQSTATDTELVSEPQMEAGTSDISQTSPLVKDIDSSKQDESLNNLESESTPRIPTEIIRGEFRDNVNLNEGDNQEVEQRIKDEEFISTWDKLKRGTLNVVKGLAGLPSSQRTDATPFEDEIKKVKQDALKEKTKLSNEEIYDKAKNIFKEKQESAIYNDKVNQYMDNLSPELKNQLKQDTFLETIELSKANKDRMKVNDVLKASIKDKFKLREELAKKEDITDEDIEQYQTLGTELQDDIHRIKTNETAFINDKSDLMTAEKELDVLKREYGGWENFTGNLGASASEIAVGGLDFMNYLGNVHNDLLTTGLDNQINQDDFVDTKELRVGIEDQRAQLRKPIEDIESVDGFVSYISDLVANQLPVLAVTSTGYGGLATLGATSTGQKYAEMNDEVLSGEASYSKLQMAGVPMLYGGAEFIGSIPMLNILKKGGRVLSAATKGSNTLVDKSAKNIATNWLKDYAGDMSKEMAGEQFTNLAQNTLNIYALGKEGNIFDNAEDVFKDTFALTTILKIAPHVVGAGLKPFQPQDKFKTLELNSQQILSLNQQLNIDGITETETNVINSQIDKLTNQSSQIMAKTIKDVNDMPRELYDEVLRLNKEAGVLRSQAQDIYVNGKSNNKEQLIQAIETQHEALQQQRGDILNGNKTVVDVLPLKEQDGLKRRALKELTEELNPDGTKNMTIDDAQITERANEIYENDKNVKAKETTQEATKPTVETATPQSEVKQESAESIEAEGVQDVKSPTVELNPNNTNETTQETTTESDGIIRPSVDQNNDQGQSQDIQPTVDSESNQGQVKVYKLGTTKKSPSYQVSVKDGVMEIKDEKGKEPSAKTKRKIRDKFAGDIDFTQGKKASVPQSENANPNEIVSTTSENASEIAELLNVVNTDSNIENSIDYKKRILADNIGNIEKQSYVDNGDANNITNGMARSYFSKKGQGRPLDTIAKELSEDFGIEITEQDIVEHMEAYPNGRNDVYKEFKDENILPLQQRFTELTGLPANDKYIQQAINQVIAKEKLNQEVNDNYLQFLSQEELLSLEQETSQYESARQKENTKTNTSDGGRIETKNTSKNEGESRSRQDGEGKGKKEAVIKTPLIPITVYHGGNLDGGSDGNGMFYVAKDKSQAKEYAKGNGGKVSEYVIDKANIASEKQARATIKRLGLKSREEGLDYDEYNLYEWIDTRFDSSLSEKDINTLIKELQSKGFEGISFLDVDMTGKSRKGSENFVIFNSKKLINDNSNTLDKFSKLLDDSYKKLDDFGKQNLSSGIPIVIAKGVIKSMQIAVKTAKTTAEVIQAGLDYLKSTKWYKSLSKTEQANINTSTIEDMVDKAINTPIDKEQAYKDVKETFQKSRDIVKRQKPLKERTRKLIRNIISKFSDRQYLSKSLVDRSGMKRVKNLMINSHGASGKAKRMFDNAYDKIYKGIDAKKRILLDEIIQSKRFIAIDENRASKGMDAVVHPDFIDAEKSKAFLEKMEHEIGSEAFKDLENRAKEYFKVYDKMLDDIYKNGMINEDVYNSLKGLDYQPRLFIEHIMDFDGEVSLSNANRQKNDTGGLSKDQINSLKEGDFTPLILDSKWLLSTSLVGRYKSIATNNMNKAFMKDEFPKAKNRFEALEKKNKKDWTKEDKRFHKYFKELDSKIIDNPMIKGLSKSGKPKFKYDSSPNKNFSKAYWYENGVRHEFFMESKLHDIWFDNIEGFFNGKSNVKEIISYGSGSALVKAIATGNNPAFAIVNTPRDYAFTVVFSDQYSKIVPKAMVQVARDVIKSIKEIKKSKTQTGNSLFEKYIEYGGDMAFLSTQGQLKKDTMLSKALNKLAGPISKDRFKGVFDAVTLSKLSTYSEIMFRMAVFQRSIKNKLDELGLNSIDEIKDQDIIDDIYNEGVANARSLLDFNQGGTTTKDLEPIIPYINTAVQGSRVAADSFRKDPLGTTSRILQASAIGSSIPVLMSLALIKGFKDDEDEEKSVYEIYSDAMDGVSMYQKSQYFSIVTGKKNEDGEYQVWKIAKNQQLAPLMVLSDNIIQNKIKSYHGADKKKSKVIYDEAIFSFKNNILPIDITSPTSAVVRNPMIKAVLTYNTGKDFFRDQPLTYDIDKVPERVEGMGSKSIEDFYKEIGKEYKMSPARMKGFTEALITSPSTNPFVGLLYGGADAMTSDKDISEITKNLGKTIYKSTGKRMVGYTSDFNRKFNTNKEIQKKLDDINSAKSMEDIEIKDIARKLSNDEISFDEFKKELSSFEPKDRERLVKKAIDYKKLKNVDRNIIDIKYERNPEAKAYMIAHFYGNILDGSKDSRNILKQMTLVKGVWTDAVKLEYVKILKSL